MESKLIFDPVHRTLRDSQGSFVKHLDCPILQSWDNLTVAADHRLGQRHCDSCEKTVFDTANMTTEEVVRALDDEPTVCLRICLEQENIEIKVENE